MSLLLDSHIILWWMEESSKLPPTARKMIDAATDKVFVSHATLWEFAIKQSTGKLHMDVEAFHQNVAADGFTWLAIAPKHITTVAQLPIFDDHKDPFDRLLVAQSLSEPLILLTTDDKLARYGTTVRVV
jgi:PIN domain nuclease of toxin-antitoxin system